MQLFGWGRKNEPNQEQPLPAAAAHPRAVLDRNEVSLDISHRLEALRPGLAVRISPSGRIAPLSDDSAADGVVVTRQPPTPGARGHTSWLVQAPASGAEVSIEADGARILKPGEKVEVPGLSDIAIGELRFTLPSYGIALPLKSDPLTVDRENIEAIATKFPRFRRGLQIFLEGLECLKKGAELQRQAEKASLAAPAGDKQTEITLAFERARNRCSAATKEAFGVSSEPYGDLINPNPTYRDAVEQLDLMRKSLSLRDETLRVLIPNLGDPTESKQRKARLLTDVDRESSTFCALMFAVQLRGAIGTALTPAVRNHPDGGKIKPETDAALFLHSLGVPLSPYFMHQNSARRAALDILAAGSGKRG